jgi:hypothetical protein
MAKEESEYDVEAGEKLDKIETTDSKSLNASVDVPAKRRPRYVFMSSHYGIGPGKHASSLLLRG